MDGGGGGISLRNAGHARVTLTRCRCFSAARGTRRARNPALWGLGSDGDLKAQEPDRALPEAPAHYWAPPAVNSPFLPELRVTRGAPRVLRCPARDCGTVLQLAGTQRATECETCPRIGHLSRGRCNSLSDWLDSGTTWRQRPWGGRIGSSRRGSFHSPATPHFLASQGWVPFRGPETQRGPERAPGYCQPQAYCHSQFAPS